MTEEEQTFTCLNPKCKKTFNQPKLIQYSACPYCLTKVEEPDASGCLYYLGYLSERPKGQAIPEHCITCEKTIESLLFKLKSDGATKEIRKWYKPNDTVNSAKD